MRWLSATILGSAVFLIALLLIPARHAGASDPWFGLDSSDAMRYLAMSNGHPAEYPWGGRWLIPEFASLFGESATTVLMLVNYLSAFSATILVTTSALRMSVSHRPVAAAWLFAATGAAYTLLFQNPFLLDSAALLLIAAIGYFHTRGKHLAVLALIVVGVAVKEVVIGFLVLQLFAKQWKLFVVGFVASAALIVYGVSRAPSGSPLYPQLGLGTVVKSWFGLGASWLLLFAALVGATAGISRQGRGRNVVTQLFGNPTYRYIAITLILAAAALPLATDTTRLLVFALPATIPLTAVVLARATPRNLLFACAMAVPATLIVIPTRVSYTLKPTVLSQLEEWYAANLVAIFAATLVAAIGAVVGGRKYARPTRSVKTPINGPDCTERVHKPPANRILP